MAPKSKSEQEKRIKELMSLVDCDASTAKKVLQATNWEVEYGANYYFDNMDKFPQSKKDTSKDELKRLFSSYSAADSTEPSSKPVISDEGFMGYLSDLGIDLEDGDPFNQVLVLAIAELLKAPPPGNVFHEEAFVSEWRRLSCPNIQSQKDYVQKTLRQAVTTDSTAYRKVYEYTFECGKETGQKSVATEDAVGLWEVFIPYLPISDAKKKKSILEIAGWWNEFVKPPKTKSINKDIWKSWREFLLETDTNFENYDESGAWPSVIDDFVEHVREVRLPERDRMQE